MLSSYQLQLYLSKEFEIAYITNNYIERLGYVRNPRSLMEGTETLRRDDIGDLLGSPDHL